MSSVRRQESKVFVFKNVCMFMCVSLQISKKANAMTPVSEITALLPVVGFIFTYPLSKVLYKYTHI